MGDLEGEGVSLINLTFAAVSSTRIAQASLTRSAAATGSAGTAPCHYDITFDIARDSASFILPDSAHVHIRLTSAFGVARVVSEVLGCLKGPNK